MHYPHGSTFLTLLATLLATSSNARSSSLESNGVGVPEVHEYYVVSDASPAPYASEAASSYRERVRGQLDAYGRPSTITEYLHDQAYREELRSRLHSSYADTSKAMEKQHRTHSWNYVTRAMDTPNNRKYLEMSKNSRAMADVHRDAAQRSAQRAEVHNQLASGYKAAVVNRANRNGLALNIPRPITSTIHAATAARYDSLRSYALQSSNAHKEKAIQHRQDATHYDEQATVADSPEDMILYHGLARTSGNLAQHHKKAAEREDLRADLHKQLAATYEEESKLYYPRQN